RAARTPPSAPTDGGAPPRRPAANDHKIVRRLSRTRFQSDLFGDLRVRWPHESSAVREYDDGQARSVHTGAGQQPPRLLVSFDVEPLEGHAVAHAQLARLG